MDDLKFKELHNLANMVLVRNHLSVLQNSTNALPRASYQPVGHLVSKLDNMFVQTALQLFKNEDSETVDDLGFAEKLKKAKQALADSKSLVKEEPKQPETQLSLEALWGEQPAEPPVEAKKPPKNRKGSINRAK